MSDRGSAAGIVASCGAAAAFFAALTLVHGQTAHPKIPPPASSSFYWEDDQPSPSGYDAKAVAATNRACKAARALQPPAADFPTPAEAKALEGCSSRDLYYGVHRPRDPVAARKCALLEMRSGEDDGGPGEMIQGPGVLVSVYANGLGARRDLDLAIHMACSIDGAKAETWGRVATLEKLKTQPNAARGFDYCGDITSGIGAGECAGLAEDIAATKRDARLKSATASWTPEQRRLLVAVRSAQKAFSEAHVDEVDAEGTIRYANWVAAGAEVDRFSDELILDLAHGKARPGEPIAADRALNFVYRKMLASDFSNGTVKPEDIRKAQRAWLKYRDAWAPLVRAVTPRQSPESVAAALTRERTRQLRGLLSDEEIR